MTSRHKISRLVGVGTRVPAGTTMVETTLSKTYVHSSIVFFSGFCGEREVIINMGCVNAHTLLAASFPPSGVYTISAVQVMEELVRCLTWPPVDPLARCGDLVIDSHSCALVVWSSRLVGLPWRVLCRPQGRCALSEL
jgi:hypothetical protein